MRNNETIDDSQPDGSTIDGDPTVASAVQLEHTDSVSANSFSAVEIEQLGSLEHRITLSLDQAAIDAAVDRRLAKARNTARVPGFRPGKAPLALVRRQFGAAVNRQQWERAAHAAVRRALSERGLRPAAAPRLEPTSGSGRICAHFEVFPQLPVIAVEQLRVEVPRVTITDADVDALLERLRQADGRDWSDRRDELRASMAAELPEALADENAFAIEEALLESVPELELPAVLLAAQIARLRQLNRAPSSSGRSGRGPTELVPTELEATARRMLGTAILMAETARQLGLRPDPAALWRETESLAASAADPQAELDRIWADGERVQDLEDQLLRNRLVSEVLARATIVEVDLGFDELVARRRARLLA